MLTQEIHVVCRQTGCMQTDQALGLVHCAIAELHGNFSHR